MRAIEIGALAEFGQAAVRVRRRSRVAILPTGDELVPIDQTPGPGRIRNSNEPMLAAQVREAGGEPVPLGIAVDEPAVLAERIARGLECDFLVLSGGVSAGQLDLVPSTLAAAGVRKVFHHVDLKPGKPIWFGVCPADIRRAHATYVFGLPGNPVSSLVCFELFVRLAIRRWLGSPETELPLQTGRLATAHVVKGDRRTYHPSRLTPTGAGIEVTPLAWHGSADLRGIVGMNGLAVFEAGQYRREAGEAVPVLWWSA